MAKDIFESFLHGTEKSLSRALYLTQQDMLRDQREKEKYERLKREITEEVTNNVLKNINVVLMDQASPQIQKLRQDIAKALQR